MAYRDIVQDVTTRRRGLNTVFTAPIWRRNPFTHELLLQTH